MVVHPVALIMPTNEPRLHQIGDRPTDTAPTRPEHTAPHLGVNDCMRLSGIGRQISTAGEFVTHCGCRRAALGITLRHRDHRI